MLCSLFFIETKCTGFLINAEEKTFVSRAANKLKAAIERFKISVKDKIETNILPKTFELVLTEKFWEQFSSQVYLFLHNISLEDVASDSMEPCQAVSSFAQA